MYTLSKYSMRVFRSTLHKCSILSVAGKVVERSGMRGEEQEEEEGRFALTYSLHVRREHTNCCKNWRDGCDEWYWMGACVEEKPT